MNENRKATHMLINYLRKIGMRRLLFMVAGNLFLGLGISIFKLSGLGNDPCNGMVMALADRSGIAYATVLIIFNSVLFIYEIWAGRSLIGAGTLVNAFLLGYIVTFFYNMELKVLGAPGQMLLRVITVLIGVIITSFGVSMYQYPDAGVAPYDSISLILSRKKPGIPYFYYRISTDAFCAVICYLAGGIIGLGTVLSAFGLGPVVQFFTIHVTSRLLPGIPPSGRGQTPALTDDSARL